jgi:hypothetical protein
VYSQEHSPGIHYSSLGQFITREHCTIVPSPGKRITHSAYFTRLGMGRNIEIIPVSINLLCLSILCIYSIYLSISSIYLFYLSVYSICQFYSFYAYYLRLISKEVSTAVLRREDLGLKGNFCSTDRKEGWAA